MLSFLIGSCKANAAWEPHPSHPLTCSSAFVEHLYQRTFYDVFSILVLHLECICSLSRFLGLMTSETFALNHQWDICIDFSSQALTWRFPLATAEGCSLFPETGTASCITLWARTKWETLNVDGKKLQFCLSTALLWLVKQLSRT